MSVHSEVSYVVTEHSQAYRTVPHGQPVASSRPPPQFNVGIPVPEERRTTARRPH